MSIPFDTLPVVPTGSRMSRPFGGPVHREEFYPDHGGQHLRETRVALDLGLREAARMIGISPMTLSGLQTGELRFVDDADWARAEHRLANARTTAAPTST